MKLSVDQENHVSAIERILRENGRALDASPMGTGKTVTAVKLMERLNIAVLVIAPKFTEAQWRRHIPSSIEFYFSTPAAFRNNYSVAKDGGRRPVNAMPDKLLTIVDEAHLFSNCNTQSSKQLLNHTSTYILLMSASIALEPSAFAVAARVLRIIGPETSFKKFIHGISMNRKINAGAALGEYIFPKYAHAMDIPVSKTVSLMHAADLPAELKDLHAAVSARIGEVYGRLGRSTVLSGEMSALELELEVARIPLIVAMAHIELAENRSICLFARRRPTLDALAREFPGAGLINGDTDEPESCIARFQRNEINVLICSIDCAGAGISLEDSTGNNPRTSFVFPGWNVTALIQALGRVSRANSKSKSRQFLALTGAPGECGNFDKILRQLNTSALLNSGGSAELTALDISVQRVFESRNERTDAGYGGKDIPREEIKKNKTRKFLSEQENLSKAIDSKLVARTSMQRILDSRFRSERGIVCDKSEDTGVDAFSRLF